MLELQQTLPNLDILDDEVDEDNVPLRRGKKKLLVFKDGNNTDEQYDIPYKKKNSDDEDEDEEDEPELDMHESDDDNLDKPNVFYESDEDNPLIAKLTNDTDSDKKLNKTNMWFNKVFRIF